MSEPHVDLADTKEKVAAAILWLDVPRVLVIHPVTAWNKSIGRDVLLGLGMGGVAGDLERDILFYFGRNKRSELRDQVLGFLKDPSRPWICHDKKKLMRTLVDSGVVLTSGVPYLSKEQGVVHDVRLQGFMVEGAEHKGMGIHALTNRTFGDQVFSGSDMLERDLLRTDRIDKVDPPVLAVKMAEDMRWIRRLHSSFFPRIREVRERGEIKRSYEPLYRVELDLAWWFVITEKRGIAIDTNHASYLLYQDWGDGAGLQSEIAYLYEHICRQLSQLSHSSPLNYDILNSRHLGQILFKEIGLPVLEGTARDGLFFPSKKNFRAYRKMLNQLVEDPSRASGHLASKSPQLFAPLDRLLELLSDLTELSRHRDQIVSIIDKTGEGGVLRPEVDTLGAKTGRIISRRETLNSVEHNEKIRSVFRVRPGFVSLRFDYSQFQFRIAAHITRDEGLLRGYTENSGFDCHESTAQGLRANGIDWADRGLGKTVNFAILFGQGAGGLARTLGCSSDKANEILTAFFKAHPSFRKHRLKAREAADKRLRNEGSAYVEDILGSRYCLDAKKTYRAWPTLVQGMEAGIFKKAMVAVYEAVREFNGSEGENSAFVLYSIYDELEIECSRKVNVNALVAKVKSEMEGAMKLRLPLVVDVKYSLTNWADSQMRNWVPGVKFEESVPSAPPQLRVVS